MTYILINMIRKIIYQHFMIHKRTLLSDVFPTGAGQVYRRYTSVFVEQAGYFALLLLIPGRKNVNPFPIARIVKLHEPDPLDVYPDLA